MATVGIQFKIMPKGLNINLEELKIKIKNTVESLDSGVFNGAKEEPIAFGLKAIIITIAISEKVDSEEIEEKLAKIHGVSSVELIDYRRVVG